MPGPPWPAGTRMFSSVDDSSDSSDTSSECWNPRSPGEYSIGSRPLGGDVSPSKLALPALATALRASRARAAAAQAKASRLLEETGRLRDALKVARTGEERANRYETELAKSEARARELESDNRRLRRDLDGARLRTRQNEAKARSSLSTLRTSLEDLEQEQRARCKRWRATTRSQRALLESLRRHVQRGLHSAPSFTAFQLIEQIFECLETLESDAQLSPARRRRQRSPSAACSPPADPSPPRRGGSPKRSPHVAAAAAAAAGRGPRVTVKGLTPTPSSASDRFNGEDDADLRTGRGRSLRATIGGAGGGGGGYFSSDGDGDGSGGGGSNVSQEDFQAQEGGGGRTAARFSTEWAYRLAVTKLTAQLKAARERLHGEKEAARSAGERVEQEELRCRQLEVEVEGLSSKVAAADGHRRRLEAMLKETKRERDALRRRQNSTAATQALSAALGVLNQRQASSSPAYPPAPQPPPPPPPPVFAATPQAPVVATAPTSQAPAVYPATGGEALYNHVGDAPRLEPSALASAYSPDGDSGGAWWEGGEGTGVESRYGQRHQPQQHTAAPATGDGFPGSPAPAVRGGVGREPPRSARHAESARVGGRELLTRSEIQRIVDDAVMNGTGRRETGGGGGGVDDVAGVGDSRAGGAELPGVGYRWRDTAPGYGTSSLLGDGGGGGGRRSAAAAAAPTAAAAFSGRRRDTAWLSSRPPATAIGRTPAERGIGAGAARVGGPPPRPKATSSEVGGGKNGGGGSVRFGGGSSLGPRSVTREDLTRLDNEIANLSKTVEQAAMAQTRQILRNVAE